MLGDDEHRPAPLTAHCESLHEPQQHQQSWRKHAHLRVGRQATDKHGGSAHQHEAQDEQLLASDPVAVVAKHEAAERTRKKT